MLHTKDAHRGLGHHVKAPPQLQAVWKGTPAER